MFCFFTCLPACQLAIEMRMQYVELLRRHIPSDQLAKAAIAIYPAASYGGLLAHFFLPKERNFVDERETRE